MTDRDRQGVPAVLSIAGSDSGGGAGIQADLKAFARCGVHGMSAITAITWQNTVAVEGVTPIPGKAIVGQVRAVATDIGVDAVKVGMLGSVETIVAVREALTLVGDAPIVLDPVMVAESGARLLDPDAVTALVALLPTGARYVVVTGGHIEEESATDYLWDGKRITPIEGPRHPGEASHGSGCTHSAALAAQLALGLAPLDAAIAAKQIASEAVRNGLRELGAGAGPVDVLGLARGNES
jgi:hydroxymethylpyrimidine/phosphomethylpyrimidine kinase